MKNIKVRTKLTIILALVIVLVTSESFISIKNMNQLKDKALETMDTSSRQNYDDSIKEQVGVVIALLLFCRPELEELGESRKKKEEKAVEAEAADGNNTGDKKQED